MHVIPFKEDIFSPARRLSNGCCRQHKKGWTALDYCVCCFSTCFYLCFFLAVNVQFGGTQLCILDELKRIAEILKIPFHTMRTVTEVVLHFVSFIIIYMSRALCNGCVHKLNRQLTTLHWLVLQHCASSVDCLWHVTLFDYWHCKVVVQQYCDSATVITYMYNNNSNKDCCGAT